MLQKTREDRIIEQKSREWELSLRDGRRKFWRWWTPIWGEIKLNMNKLIEEIWFSKAKTTGDRAWHVIIWLLCARAFIRIWWEV
mgnify:CR=1 FL=1